MSERTREVRVRRGGVDGRDEIATEAPLAIRVRAGERDVRVAVTMRTPGEDGELAVGFLFAEGAIGGPEDLAPGGPPVGDGEEVRVHLANGHLPDLAALDRHVFTSSACGACGKTCLENLLPGDRARPGSGPALDPAVLLALPDQMREAQAGFAATGGLHAAALFTSEGELLLLREDVGRHNALDKVVGRSLLDGELPLTDRVVLVSGRASFELVQKAAAAGAPVLAAISAPSTMAVETAERTGVTLVAFLRDGRFGVYANPERILRRA